jgi:hypothetical protein
MKNLTSVISVDDVLEMSLDELAVVAFDRARAAHGHVVTYSPKVFIPSRTCAATDVVTALSPRPPRASRRPT